MNSGLEALQEGLCIVGGGVLLEESTTGGSTLSPHFFRQNEFSTCL